VRVKNPRVWTIVNKIDERLKLIVKVWRGYLVRKRLKLAGPGVLNRSKCTNEEDIGTFDEKEKVHPLNYFGFNENSNVYWADIRSMIALLKTNTIPQNPYTRNDLSIEARRRLREIYKYRLRNAMSTAHNKDEYTLETIVADRWLQISQIIYEHEIDQINPIRFQALSSGELFEFLNTVLVETYSWATLHTKTESKRYKYYYLIRTGVEKYYEILDTTHYSYVVSTLLLYVLYDCNDSFDFAFIISTSFCKL
jgi:hypothetical protein